MADAAKESPWAIIGAFAADLGELNKVLDHLGTSPFVARTFVRTIFSVFDGYSWYLKHRALEGAPYAQIELTSSELEVIEEQRVKSRPDGTTTMVPKMLTSKDNLLFAIKLYARVRGSEPPLVKGALPAEFHVASTVRNRITHPKKATDFDVTRAEMRAIGTLGEWFKTLMLWAGAEEQKNIDEFGERSRIMSEEAHARFERPRTDTDSD